jgi:hypothetical protein
MPAPTPSAYDQPASRAEPTAIVARPAEIATVRAAGQGGKAATQVSLDVVSLVRSKQMQSAIVLSEILGPPLSLRRRRR